MLAIFRQIVIALILSLSLYLVHVVVGHAIAKHGVLQTFAFIFILLLILVALGRRHKDLKLEKALNLNEI